MAKMDKVPFTCPDTKIPLRINRFDFLTFMSRPLSTYHILYFLFVTGTTFALQPIFTHQFVNNDTKINFCYLFPGFHLPVQ